MTPPARTSTVMGLAFDAIRERACVEHVVRELDAGRGGVIVTANLDHLRRSVTDFKYRRIARGAEMLVADGMPIVWASRLRGDALPERVSGASLMLPLVEAMGERGRRVFLLGGNPGVAERAGRELEARCGVEIAGTRCPPVGFEGDPEEMDAMRRQLRDSGADLVLVALGSPKQEYLIDQIREALPDAWWAGIGISLSFLIGEVPRAPGWMQRAGLEWVQRLAAEPRRLTRRYLIDGIPFGVRLIGWSVATRLGLIGRRTMRATI
ncbi:MAG: WecB/TagA/CpsF family glycosyltransferase [Phycisphaerales bacterium]